MSDDAAEVLHKVRVATLVVLPLLGTVGAVILLWNRHIFPKDLAIFFGMYLATSLGVTVGYHRMLAHRSFEGPSWLRGLLLILGCMAFEGRPDTWAATHIKHHAHSDEEGDPHSPLDGFWHAHFGWLFSRENFPEPKEYAPHLLEDPVVQFVSEREKLWYALSLAIPFLLGGWTGLVWGGGVRIFLLTHVTWSVNSVCHCFGRRPFETSDESRNHWVVGLLGFGEGWHNNHHAFPTSAFHGLHWWQFDLSGVLIRIFEKLGFVWKVQRVHSDSLQAYMTKSTEKLALLQALRTEVFEALEKTERELQDAFARTIERSLTSLERGILIREREQAFRRIQDIRNALARATHLKKQRLLLYLGEVSKMPRDIQRLTMVRT